MSDPSRVSTAVSFFEEQPGITSLGVAFGERCSEAEPQCTGVGIRPDGTVVLRNAEGQEFAIPATEVAGVTELLNRI